ncbi:MAG: NAD-dependent epimerase/dehydratase family protein [Thermoleophilia bacterium]|nr:NAD-dependent epimerase/dehydratase family protein [Thermoleophilia bacterium]
MEYWTSVANQHSEYWLSPANPVLPPTPESAEVIADAYWVSLQRSLCGIVRADGETLGPIRLVVAKTGITILVFDTAEIVEVEGGIELAFPIIGGSACAAAAGHLRLIARVEGAGVHLGVVVDGYRPRFERLHAKSFLIAAPYTLSQHLVHGWVTKRGLQDIARVIDPIPVAPPSLDTKGRLNGLRVGVVGASGYVGRRLVPELRDQGARVRAIARRPNPDLEQVAGIEIVRADALDRESLNRAFGGLDVVYWLVHSMGAGGDFAELDRVAARNAAGAAAQAGVQQIIYLSGLGDDDPELSHHLQSRHETGRVMAEGVVPVTTLRAAMVVGQQSASFQMMRDLVHRLPAMVTPRWVTTRSQPIAFADLRDYLVGVCALPAAYGRTLDVGGPDILTFQEMMERVAVLAGRRKPFIVPVPVLSPKLSSLWCGLVTAVDTNIARPLVEGLRNETICLNDEILQLVPKERMSFDDAVRRALQGVPLRY